MKVLAIIVTYNRLELLKRCIKSISHQSVPPDKIVIVNNGSNDGTFDYLSKSSFEYISQDNLGSAGGWHTAIDYGVKNKYEYIWLMDDDGFPEKNALSQLLSNFSENISCISSVVVDETDKSKMVFPMPVYVNIGKKKFIIPLLKTRNYLKLKQRYKFYEFCHLFNGALIRTKTVKEIGNVNKDYFLYGDEVDYFNRLKLSGKIFTMMNSIHYHPPRANNRISNIWLFYTLKNSIINNYKYNKFYNINNLLVILLLIFRLFIRNGIFELVSYLFGKYNFIFYKAIIFGYRKKIGQNYPK